MRKGSWNDGQGRRHDGHGHNASRQCSWARWSARGTSALRILTVPLVVLATTSCLILRGKIELESVPLQGQQRVETPVRAHLIDGTIAFFPEGVSVDSPRVVGAGWHYGYNLRDSVEINEITLDRILALEAYHDRIDAASSTLYTVLGTVLTIGTAIGVYCATNPKCFGSCPTVYSDSAGTPVLEAEGFSYSIAPLFEARDIDRLRATADSAGIVRLEIRNEAFETHYINHLELLEAVHANDERVVPTSDNGIIAVRNLRAPRTATDRSGRPVLDEIESHDGTFFQSSAGVLAAATEEDLTDTIELDPGDFGGADSVVMVFRMRNSLLATVLFYDLMLGDRGARALDWQTFDLENLSTAVELGEWSREHLGMHVSVMQDDRFQTIGRIGDSGPVAWKDVAIVIPAPDRNGRIRLSFPADGWRIDWLAFSSEWRRIEPRIVPLTRVATRMGEAAEAQTSLARADTKYLVTSPSQAFVAEFDVGNADHDRMFLLASQGYYIEWIRREWLLTGADSTAFRPERRSLADAIQRWAVTQNTLEKRFYATRVPVR